MTFELSSPVPVPEQQPPPTDERVKSLPAASKKWRSSSREGLTNRRIASELSISERTAGNHVAKILKKHKLRSRTQITAWVTQRRLLPSDLD